MENMNFLDLDDDILNIIGDYVKKDNHDRMEKMKQEKLKQDIFDYADIQMKLKEKKQEK